MAMPQLRLQRSDQSAISAELGGNSRSLLLGKQATLLQLLNAFFFLVEFNPQRLRIDRCLPNSIAMCLSRDNCNC